MLNAYGRVDKGKLIKLDRGDDSKSAFGPVIGQTFDHFKKQQNVTNHQKELNSSRSQQSAGSKRHSDKYSNSKIGSNNINENSTSTSTSNDDSDRKTGTTTDSRPSTSGLNNASNKKNKSSDPNLTSNSTHITDTLLSNLLINSVLSALRSGICTFKHSPVRYSHSYMFERCRLFIAGT